MSFFESLAGKIALVTGGSRGVGPAIVQRLADDGATVVFTHVDCPSAARELVTRIEANGGTALAIEADSAAPGELEKAVAEAVARFGRIDILVSNADLLAFHVANGLALQAVDESLTPCLRALFVPVQTVISHMPTGGRIIAVSAASDWRPHNSAPGTSRSAANVSRGLARDLGSRGITFNLVRPGSKEPGSCSDERNESSKAGQFVTRRMREDVDVASLVAYLASEEARFINGAALAADGGCLA